MYIFTIASFVVGGEHF